MAAIPAIASRSASARIPSTRIAWAVNVASKYVPALQTCLTRALAAHLLLTRRGHPARLHVGVAKHPPGVLHAHAWIESDGEVVVGGTDLAGFTPLYVGQLRDA